MFIRHTEAGEVLNNIVSSVENKHDSLFKFFEELATTDGFLSLAIIKRVSEKYAVPVLYKDLISDRFIEFKSNIRMVCIKNKEMESKNRNPGLSPDKWIKNGLQMFSSTEKMTIESIGGLDVICRHIHDIGYFDYLFKVFKESAVNVSQIKYSLLLNDESKKIEYKS
jgi:hypothetical protein